MKTQTFRELYDAKICADAIINDEYKGFKEDYLMLHLLLKKHMPKSVFEIGTNMGAGTNIIKNAIGNGEVFSLDLPTEMAHKSLQHPINEGKGDRVGHRCKLPFTQLRGDSMKFDYSKYPTEAAFIDGEHDYDHPNHETKEILKNNTKLIIWHDSDIELVYNAIIDAFKESKQDENYDIYRIVDTRISYAIRK